MSAVLNPPKLSHPQEGPELLRLTVDQYLAMAEKGAFEGLPRTELFEGALVRMAPQGPGHMQTISTLIDLLGELKRGTGFRLAVQSTQPLGEGRALEPDMLIWKAKDEGDDIRFPQTEEIALVVEVSQTSLAYDAGDKRRIYAAEGIPEYWIVDLEKAEILVHTDPNPGEACYRNQRAFTRGMTLSPQFAHQKCIAAADALRFAAGKEKP